MTVADIVPAGSMMDTSVFHAADLSLLRATLQDQVSAPEDDRLFFEGDEEIVVHNNVLLRFAVKEAYYSGQSALRLRLGL